MDEVLQRKSNLSSSEKCLKIRKTLVKRIKKWVQDIKIWFLNLTYHPQKIDIYPQQ